MRKCGVLVISHGSRDEEWVRLVQKAVFKMELSRNIPVECSFLELVEGKLIQDGIDRLEDAGVEEMIVVPLFVSSGSTHIDEISWAIGAKPQPVLETELEPFRVNARIHLCAPLNDDALVSQILYDKLKPLSLRPEQEVVLLIGHGSRERGFYSIWKRGMKSLAQQVKQLGGFAEVDVAMLVPDEVGDQMKSCRERYSRHEILVAPLFLSEGYFTKRVIPDRLKNHEYRYNGKAILPHPLVTCWLEQQVEQTIRQIEEQEF